VAAAAHVAEGTLACGAGRGRGEERKRGREAACGLAQPGPMAQAQALPCAAWCWQRLQVAAASTAAAAHCCSPELHPCCALSRGGCECCPASWRSLGCGGAKLQAAATCRSLRHPRCSCQPCWLLMISLLAELCRKGGLLPAPKSRAGCCSPCGAPIPAAPAGNAARAAVLLRHLLSTMRCKLPLASPAKLQPVLLPAACRSFAPRACPAPPCPSCHPRLLKHS